MVGKYDMIHVAQKRLNLYLLSCWLLIEKLCYLIIDLLWVCGVKLCLDNFISIVTIKIGQPIVTFNVINIRTKALRTTNLLYNLIFFMKKKIEKKGNRKSVIFFNRN